MKTIILIVSVIIVLFVAFVIEENITSRLYFKRIEQINERMAILRDRAKTNPPDTNALNSLILALQSKDSWTRDTAAGVLGQVGSNAEPAVDSLIKILERSDPYNPTEADFGVKEAAQSLGEIGPGARRAIPALIKAVQQHPEEGAGFSAAKSLGQIANTNDTEVVTVLTQAAKSSDERMRFSANEGIQTLMAQKNTAK
jgi:HEAT repeat protein